MFAFICTLLYVATAAADNDLSELLADVDESDSCQHGSSCHTNLLQIVADSRWNTRIPESCTSLDNHGTHFTVQVEVGTPPQKFDVVADTGSDSLIVTSCVCQDMGRCQPSDKCFRGINHSSSFTMNQSSGDAGVPAVLLTFGSGQIQAVVASDVVRVGKVKAHMEDGVLLMVDQALRIDGPFEGILGLGLPPPKSGTKRFNESQRPQLDVNANQSSVQGESGDGLLSRHGFLQAARVARFSMCFNDGAGGVLRLSIPRPATSLGSVGHYHWGLDFRGISVGDVRSPVSFCTQDSMSQGQTTPCGAIPDSGTTVMMAPKEHIPDLFASICDNWGRCKEAAEKDPFTPKHEVLQLELLQCENWLNESGLEELPALHFHVVGSEGTKSTLSLPGSAYIIQTMRDEVHYVTKHLLGIFPIQIPVSTGEKKKVCTPAFASHDYNTSLNGPVWILGLPLFYKYQVGYDLHKEPPAISFLDEPCGSCSTNTGERTAAFVSQSRTV